MLQGSLQERELVLATVWAADLESTDWVLPALVPNSEQEQEQRPEQEQRLGLRLGLWPGQRPRPCSQLQRPVVLQPLLQPQVAER